MSTQRYETDLTDEQFALVEPLLPRPKPMGRPPADPRRVLNGILYLVRTGCQWRLLPKDFPPWSTVHTWYRRWRKDGTWRRLNEALRHKARERAGRDPSPRSSAVDSQSVKAAGQGGQAGFDNGKKVRGRKRHLWVDSTGLLLAVLVTADIFSLAPFRLQVIGRPEGSEGFVKLPQRWVVERTIAWLGRSRRLSKDYERDTGSSEAMAQASMIHLMLRRLAPTQHSHTQRFRYAA
jgi:putative transposase